MVGVQAKQTIMDDDPYGQSGLFSGGGGWRNNSKRNYGGMFGEEDGEAGLFNAPAPVGQAAPRNQAPVISNGLFGGNALKDDEVESRPKAGGAAKLNSIFDYEEEEEAPQQMQMAPPGQGKKPMGMGAKGGGLFSIDEDDDEGFGFLGGKNTKGVGSGF